MYSLPAGWHGIPVLSKNGVASKSATVPTTIRKKWNSPQSKELPRSKLPAYKPLNMRDRLYGTSSYPCTFYRPKKSDSVSPQKENAPTVKSPPSKELQNEIAKLKKELATMKTENSILKVKVRRVDDENVQKSRQIDKLMLELKAAQKVESTNGKKNKDSELLLLRQKCLRLEGALREKDLSLNTFRKLNSASRMGEMSKNKLNSSILEPDDIIDDAHEDLDETLKSSFTAHLNTSITSHRTKSEVSKLRDIIHKLEKQNQDLQQQVKDKGEEIRCLKIHLKSQTYTKSSQASSRTSVLNTSSKSSVPSILANTSFLSISKKDIPNTTSRTSLPNIPSKSSFKPASNMNKSISEVPNRTQSRKSRSKDVNLNEAFIADVKSPTKRSSKILPKNPDLSTGSVKVQPKSSNRTSLSGAPVLKTPSKKMNGSRLRTPDRPVKKKAQASVSQPEAPNLVEESIEDKAQRLRENSAAKKIQRGWRNHQEKFMNSKTYQMQLKAMAFFCTSMKHHKSRKGKLNMLHKRKNSSLSLELENDTFISEAIDAANKILWAKECDTSN